MNTRRIIFAVLAGLSVHVAVFMSGSARATSLKSSSSTATGIAVLALPGMIVAVAIMAVGRRRDNETRCRKCGYILRGLTEPRCSECGEPI